MYQRIAECTTDGVCVVDLAHRIVFANAQLAALLNFPDVRLVVGRSTRQLVPPAYHPGLDATWAELAAGLPAAREAELMTATQDLVAVSLTACPYYEGERFAGAVVRVVESGARRARERELIDGRERAEAALDEIVREQDERTKLEGQAQRRQRLEALGRLTGGVAHDFNNFLTVICGAAESLVEDQADPAEVADLGRLILEAAEKGAALISQLLAFARRQPLEPKPLEIGRLLCGMELLLRRTLGADVEMVIAAAPDSWPAMADAAQLETAILNLAINAREAMPGGGKLTIETTNVCLDQAYADANLELVAGDYVLVAVSDTGTGMAPQTLERAFDPFFTTKAASGGTGLGLSMVYGFAKQTGGQVKIYSEPGVGSSVKLYLPRAAAELAPRPDQPIDAAMPRGSEHILVVEDDPVVQRYVVSQLAGLGYRITVANDGPEALKVLETGGSIDLMFTDVVMPRGMSGRDLAEAAAVRRPGLRVLYTSGYTENAIVHNGRLDPGVDLLSKPYRRRELAVRVRRALDAPRPTPAN